MVRLLVAQRAHLLRERRQALEVREHDVRLPRPARGRDEARDARRCARRGREVEHEADPREVGERLLQLHVRLTQAEVVQLRRREARGEDGVYLLRAVEGVEFPCEREHVAPEAVREDECAERGGIAAARSGGERREPFCCDELHVEIRCQGRA